MPSPKTNNQKLLIGTRLTAQGLALKVLGREYQIKFPAKIWRQTPPSVKQTLGSNLTFANTHLLPLILDKKEITYQSTPPCLGSFFFKNQIYDLLDCEKSDGVKHLSYLKKFYNLDYYFATGPSILPRGQEIVKFNQQPPPAIIPFSFGKESLLTFGLCQELGLEPILVYCQEPSHPYEEKYKLKKLKEVSQKFKVKTHFIVNEPGLFRYGRAFKTASTEIGWGAQTTILTLLMIPFAHYYQAKYILFGSEYDNNRYCLTQGWKSYLSFDQTANWGREQDTISRLLTNNQTSVKTSLEVLEQITIFYILVHRFPHLLPYLFSCTACRPLAKNSAWCHQCYKCERIFTFCLALDVDPAQVGFTKDLTLRKDYLEKYYFEESDPDLVFALYLLSKKGGRQRIIKKFKSKIKKIPSWNWHKKYFTNLKNQENILDYRHYKLLKIFTAELENFKKLLPR